MSDYIKVKRHLNQRAQSYLMVWADRLVDRGLADSWVILEPGTVGDAICIHARHHTAPVGVFTLRVGEFAAAMRHGRLENHGLIRVFSEGPYSGTIVEFSFAAEHPHVVPH